VLTPCIRLADFNSRYLTGPAQLKGFVLNNSGRKEEIKEEGRKGGESRKKGRKEGK
jgi:hypothetical protein